MVRFTCKQGGNGTRRNDVAAVSKPPGHFPQNAAGRTPGVKRLRAVGLMECLCNAVMFCLQPTKRLTFDLQFIWEKRCPLVAARLLFRCLFHFLSRKSGGKPKCYLMDVSHNNRDQVIQFSRCSPVEAFKESQPGQNRLTGQQAVCSVWRRFKKQTGRLCSVYLSKPEAFHSSSWWSDMVTMRTVIFTQKPE